GLAYMAMLVSDGGEPVLPSHRIDILRLDTFRRKPVRPLPAELRAEDRALRLQPRVERRDDAWAAAFVFLVREADCVVLAIGLQRTVEHPLAIAVHARKAADIDHPEIEGGLAVDDPLRQNPASPSSRGNAEGVETRTDEHVRAFGRHP